MAPRSSLPLAFSEDSTTSTTGLLPDSSHADQLTRTREQSRRGIAVRAGERCGTTNAPSAVEISPYQCGHIQPEGQRPVRPGRLRSAGRETGPSRPWHRRSGQSPEGRVGQTARPTQRRNGLPVPPENPMLRTITGILGLIDCVSDGDAWAVPLGSQGTAESPLSSHRQAGHA